MTCNLPVASDNWQRLEGVSEASWSADGGASAFGQFSGFLDPEPGAEAGFGDASPTRMYVVDAWTANILRVL